MPASLAPSSWGSTRLGPICLELTTLALLAALGRGWFEGGREAGQDVQRAAAVATGRVALTVMMLVTLPVARTSVWLWMTGKNPPTRPPSLPPSLLASVLFVDGKNKFSPALSTCRPSFPPSSRPPSLPCLPLGIPFERALAFHKRLGRFLLVVASVHLGFSLSVAPLKVGREGGREGGREKRVKGRHRIWAIAVGLSSCMM